MNARAYVLLDIVNTRVREAAGTLRNVRGVKAVDMLEGSPNLVMIVQARNRQQLAKVTNEALASVETMTENMQLLPVQNNEGT